MASGRFQISNRAIIGVGLLLFSAVCLAAGMHHVIKTGTCSSTGYSANYGPVPYCPKGTGLWILLLTGGIFGCLIGAGIAGGFMLIIPAIFSAIGAGAASIQFDHGAGSGSKTFGLIFGLSFLVFGGIPGLFILWSSIKKALRPSGGPARVRPPTAPITSSSPLAAQSGMLATSANKEAAAAFGGGGSEPDAILGAYASGSGGLPGVPGAGIGSSTAPASGTASGFTNPPAFPAPPPFPKPPPFAPGGSVLGTAVGGRAPKADVFDKINKLAELHKAGALTDAEFAREKAKLLADV